jgi:hypothetical protein
MFETAEPCSFDLQVDHSVPDVPVEVVDPH